MSDPVYSATQGAFAELVAQGVTTAVVSPGSRSTPLTIAASRTSGLTTVMHLDERSAAFHALGIAKATGSPVALVCTSGTAAANYLPAVVEAHYSGVPLIVFTADRPPELRDWGAGQTIDQVDIYGSHVRWAAELAVAGSVESTWFRRMAARAVAEATAPDPGPVHLNWPFREPLEPSGDVDVSTDPIVRLNPPARPAPTAHDLDRLAELVAHERGLIVSGPADFSAEEVAAIADFAASTGWPIVAEPSSQLRFGPHTASDDGPLVVSAADQIFRTGWARRHVPDVLIRIGDSPTCKPFRLLVEAQPPAHHVLIDPDRRWNEASFTATQLMHCDPAQLMASTSCDRGSSTWTEAWAEAETTAATVMTKALADGSLLEAQVARITAEELGGDHALYVSNSMPVRDLDTFAPTQLDGPRVFTNRGASGIDGLISCADGVASTGRPTALLIGDIATLHDVGGLLHAARSGNPLTLVVPNNDGGGIFSFLPVAAHGDAVDFHELFHTPHGTTLGQLGALDGVDHHTVATADDLRATLAKTIERPGVDIIEIPIELDANMAQHRAISAAVAEALA